MEIYDMVDLHFWRKAAEKMGMAQKEASLFKLEFDLLANSMKSRKQFELTIDGR